MFRKGRCMIAVHPQDVRRETVLIDIMRGGRCGDSGDMTWIIMMIGQWWLTCTNSSITSGNCRGDLGGWGGEETSGRSVDTGRASISTALRGGSVVFVVTTITTATANFMGRSCMIGAWGEKGETGCLMVFTYYYYYIMVFHLSSKQEFSEESMTCEASTTHA